VIFPKIPRISTPSSKPSASSRRIYEKRPSELFRASRAESQRLWPHSAGKNAPITSDMQDMRLGDRNPHDCECGRAGPRDREAAEEFGCQCEFGDQMGSSIP